MISSHYGMNPLIQNISFTTGLSLQNNISYSFVLLIIGLYMIVYMCKGTDFGQEKGNTSMFILRERVRCLFIILDVVTGCWFYFVGIMCEKFWRFGKIFQLVFFNKSLFCSWGMYVGIAFVASYLHFVK